MIKPLLVLTLPSLLLTSCVVDPSAMSDLNYNPATYSPVNSYAADQQAAYSSGYRRGRTDALSARGSDFRRYSYEYSPATQSKFAEGYRVAYSNYRPHDVHGDHSNGYGQMTASVGQGQVRIMQGGRVVSTLRTAAPNVEKHHFKEGQKQIVVKSRGNHGPATVELFDTKTGVLRDKILAYAIKNGHPKWARGMQD